MHSRSVSPKDYAAKKSCGLNALQPVYLLAALSPKLTRGRFASLILAS